MQVQDIHNLASSQLQAAHLPAPAQTESQWKCLPLHWLQNYQRVERLFAGFQVEFESAIAIRPSNPRFQAGDLPIAIMSPGQGKNLKVNLGKGIKAIEVWLVGGESAIVSALDDAGHYTAIARTQALSTPETTHQFSAQSVTLKTDSAEAIRIDSKAPFVLTRLAIQHH